QLYIDSLSGLSKDVWLLTTVMFINRMGAMVLPFVTIYMTQNLGFTLSETGIVMMCYGAGSLAGVFIGGKLTDKIGAWTVQVVSLFLTGIGFFILRNVTTLEGFCILYFSLALVADTFRPANMVSMGLLSKPENRTRSMSLLRLAINLGYGAGTAIGGFLALQIGYDGLFIVDGTTCILAGVFFIAMIPHKRRTQEEKATAAAGQKAGKSPYKDRNFLLFSLMVFLTAVAFMQLFTTIPVFFKDVFLMDEGQIGMVMAVNCFLLAGIEMPIIHQLELKKYSKLKMCAIGTFLIMIAHLPFLLPGTGMALVWAYMLIITFGEMINFPFASAYALDASDPATRGAYMGVYGMVWSSAFIVAPLLGFNLAEQFGWKVMWTVVAIFALVGSIGYWFLADEMKKTDLKFIVKTDVFENPKLLETSKK
ncbi:MAG: MFS family permease, partial [Saprospiraceae bacterium]